MKEKQFNNELVASIRAHGGWAFKPSDARMGGWNLERPTFTPPKPCDLLVCWRGKFIAIESKQIKKWQAFGPNVLSPNQIKNLDAIEKAGGQAVVALNVRIPREEDRLLFFRYEGFSRLEKSIHRDKLKELTYVTKKKGIYDVHLPFGGL